MLASRSSQWNQPIDLSEYIDSNDEQQCLLCSVRVLRHYGTETADVAWTEQLSLCFSVVKQGFPLSKQCLSHWMVEMIELAYMNSGQTLPVHTTGHSVRGVATSRAALKGVLLSECSHMVISLHIFSFSYGECCCIYQYQLFCPRSKSHTGTTPPDIVEQMPHFRPQCILVSHTTRRCHNSARTFHVLLIVAKSYI